MKRELNRVEESHRTASGQCVRRFLPVYSIKIGKQGEIPGNHKCMVLHQKKKTCVVKREMKHRAKDSTDTRKQNCRKPSSKLKN